MECHHALAQSYPESIRVPVIQETVSGTYKTILRSKNKMTDIEIYTVRVVY